MLPDPSVYLLCKVYKILGIYQLIPLNSADICSKLSLKNKPGAVQSKTDANMKVRQNEKTTTARRATIRWRTRGCGESQVGRH
jgi:hypothetical protein